ncbi:MAG TPA: Rne/Rng family ribonuclease [Lapillicoccus sp.]|nr:Rne/Rng family ribonuclease [Lapillicoccus sp.]
MASEQDHTEQNQQDHTAPSQAEQPTLDAPTDAPTAAETVSDDAAPSAAPARARARKATAKAAKTTTAKRATKATASPAKKATKTATATTTKAAKATTAKSTRTTKKAAAAAAGDAAAPDAPVETTAVELSAPETTAPETAAHEAPASGAAAEAPAPAKRGRRRAARPVEEAPAPASLVDEDALRFDALDTPVVTADQPTDEPDGAATEATGTAYGPLFQAPSAPARRRRRASAPSAAPTVAPETEAEPAETPAAEAEPVTEAESDEGPDAAESTETPRRRRRRGGKGRRSRSSAASAADDDAEATTEESTEGKGEEAESDEGDTSSTSRRRTRRRRRSGSADADKDEPGVTTKVRESRRDEVTALKGSTRLEAKKQRRREGREAGRRRTIITEAEFLARRESVERVMVVRHVGDRTQIGVLEDGVLVEHYISRETTVSMAGNIYLGRVQNVLPSMEAAFVDIGKGRNAVLYAGEVNWDAAGLDPNQPKRIENALTSGESVLVQVTKDPIGHKGARLTSQISLPGRYLVYVPNSSMTGISRKLPDTERSRLKKILKEVVPDTAGVIVRTAAEGASEEELRADVERLTATWADITAKAEAASGGGGKKKNKGGSAPLLLHGEPDLTVRVIRDIFNEDFAQLVVAGDQAWQEVSEYVTSVAPDLAERVTKWTSEEDLFTQYRVDEQIAKAMDRKVWLPSGGSLVIDRTEAMTVVDVNTGKFIGSGGNLEETVTKNNLEAAEEMVRQLRLRDVGGIIVIDFIDMVLESNRDLVVRRLLECLGRDRTKHQVAEVTSLGLVQMTRKRVGSGLIEVFSETCEVCGGRGILIHTDPVDKSGNGHDHGDGNGSGQGRGQNGRSRGRSRTPEPPAPVRPGGPTPAQIAAAAHAAALKSSAYAGADGAEDGSPDVAALAQDLPLAVVLEQDLEEAGAEPTVVEALVVEETVEGAEEPVAAAEPEPEPALEAEPQPEPEPATGGDEPAYETEVTAPPTRPRRHRGRVVAPAGPPRSLTAAGDGDG